MAGLLNAFTIGKPFFETIYLETVQGGDCGLEKGYNPFSAALPTWKKNTWSQNTKILGVGKSKIIGMPFLKFSIGIFSDI